ncbi:unnamed protein product [Sphacelaria rigidula]
MMISVANASLLLSESGDVNSTFVLSGPSVFHQKSAVENKYLDLIDRDFDDFQNELRWLKSRPIRSGYLFPLELSLWLKSRSITWEFSVPTAHFRSKSNVLINTHSYSENMTRQGLLDCSIHEPIASCYRRRN